MDSTALSTLIHDAARDLGFDLVGIAPVGPNADHARFVRWLDAGYHGEMDYLARRAAERENPAALLPEARTIIVLGASYWIQDAAPELRDDPSRGRIAAYAWSDDYHELLKPLLFRLDETIRNATGRASLGKAFVDTGPVLERSWARAAGLGFIGKNTCLIAPKRGSCLFLGVLLIPEVVAGRRWQVRGASCEVAPPLHSAPGLRATCGHCSRCLDACPTHAFAKPHVLDARRCISYLTIELQGPVPLELRPLMGNWIFGCDLCQQVCPYNRRFAAPSRLPMFQPRPEMVAPRLLDLLALDETTFRSSFHRSPVRRARRRGLLRNVCIALGNWGHPCAIPGLVNALHDAEPLIRGHAAWALGRIDTRDARAALQERWNDEPDRYPRQEIAQALAP